MGDEDEESEEYKEAAEDENDRLEEEELQKRMADPRVDTASELIMAITKPTVKKKYTKYVSRDLAVGNIPKNRPEIVDQVRRYISLMSDFIFLDAPEFRTIEMADIYNADLKAFLSALRSVGGFERKQQTTLTTIKGKLGGEGESKSKFGLK